MPNSPETYKTYIQFIKPHDVHDPNFHGSAKRDKRNLKSVNIKVPTRISDTWFCSMLVPDKLILDMLPPNEAKHIVWKQLEFFTYKKNEAGDLVPNDVKIRVKKDGVYKTLILPLEEFKNLHLEAMHRKPKKKARKSDEL